MPFLADRLFVEAADEGGDALRVGARRDLGEHVGERLAQLLGRLVAVLARRRQRAHQQLVERGRDPGRLGRRRLRARMAHQRHRRRRIHVGELQVLVPGQQLPQHDPQAVDVGAGVRDLAPRLLGGEVRRAAEHDAGRGLFLLEHAARQPEVRQLHLAEVAEEDVGRRDVAVDEVQVAVAVDVGERARDLAPDVQRDVERDARPRADAAVPDLAQVLAFDQVHRDEELAVDLTGVEGRHQVGVRQTKDDLRLVEKPVGLGVVAALGDDLLDDAALFEAAVAGRRKIDLPHPAPRHRLEQDVLAKSARVAPSHRLRSRNRCTSLACREPERFAAPLLRQLDQARRARPTTSSSPPTGTSTTGKPGSPSWGAMPPRAKPSGINSAPARSNRPG